MGRLNILCLAHPATWKDKVAEVKKLRNTLLSINKDSKSWIKLNGQVGKRSGIYALTELSNGAFTVLKIVAEVEPTEEVESLERILKNEGQLPPNTEVPGQVPRAHKGVCFVDLEQGVCYIYSPGVQFPEEIILDILRRLENDVGLPASQARMFQWNEDQAREMAEVTREKGFIPYRSEADLEDVRLIAIGNLMSPNERWKRVEEDLKGDWRVLAFLKQGDMLVFGMTKRFRKALMLPETQVSDLQEILQIILQLRSLLEEAIKADIRQYCFPEPVTPLSGFLAPTRVSGKGERELES